MKLTTTETQYKAIDKKFAELRVESLKIRYPVGAKPTSADLWAMATQLVISENK
ncbi:hypothetical protein VPHD148_0217 [Vibrio phage D148]